MDRAASAMTAIRRAMPRIRYCGEMGIETNIPRRARGGRSGTRPRCRIARAIEADGIVGGRGPQQVAKGTDLVVMNAAIDNNGRPADHEFEPSKSAMAMPGLKVEARGRRHRSAASPSRSDSHRSPDPAD